VIRIDILPDDVLLEIFDFYVDMRSSYEGKTRVEEWQSLVHVCRRWRSLVLGSPRRLNLRLYCTPETPARDTLDVWPALPLTIHGRVDLTSGTNNIIAALGQSNRVCEVFLFGITERQLEEVLAAMQVPFPELTDLELFSDGKTVPVIPDSFLDGSAPYLKYFALYGIPFPGLPKLLLSATHLVTLYLSNIPHSGYISPKSIVALISVLSSLETLTLGFESPQSRPDRETRRPPSKRSVIPALLRFTYIGVIEYLEDLVTAIDTPQLDNMQITLFNQIDFDTPRLAQFINRTPKLGKRDAIVEFSDNFAHVGHSPETLLIRISCIEPDWQLSSIEQVCNSCLHPLSTVEHLYIEHRYWQPVWKDDAIENTLWLQLLLPFTALNDLYLSKEFAPGIAAALQDLVRGRIMEVLPSLQNILVEALEPSGPFQENIWQFVAARQLCDHPIVISVWDKDSNVKPM
jgi:F-box-like